MDGEQLTVVEWLFGDSLLAAPVLADVTSRDIHVPAGRWYDVLRHRVVRGPTELTGYPTALADVPLFVRLGTHQTGMLMRALVSGHHRGGGTSGR